MIVHGDVYVLQAKIGEFELNNIFKIRRSQLALKGWNIPLFYRTVIDEFQKLNEIKISSGGDVRTSKPVKTRRAQKMTGNKELVSLET